MAPFIPEDKISDIRNAADIVEIISETVRLKKAGKDYIGLCPFHSEKTPSFTVSPEKQIFYCFGCGTGGNVFSFLMKQENLSFPEALRSLAVRYGIDIPTRHLSPEQQQLMDERESLFAVNRQAADYFHDILLNAPAGKKARAYLEKRGISEDIIRAFCIGYDPSGRESFTAWCRQKKILARAEKAGLIAAKDGRFYDRFWERIVFPISDIRNRVIAFGGRVLDDAGPNRPKYLNSPETPLYSKSRSLYGLHIARQKCRENRTVYIAEGYLDLVALHRYGIENAVATLGTALTGDHLRMIRGFADKIILVYDSDDAGIAAARRSSDLFRKEETDAYILVLEPPGHDPDSYLSEFGAEAFLKSASRARGVISFLTDLAVKKHGLSAEGKIRIISEMTGPIAAVTDNVARSLYIRDLAERVAADEIEIINKIKEFSSAGPDDLPPGDLPNPSRGPHYKLERKIIAMMLQFPQILPEIRQRDMLEYFENERLQSLGQAILKHEYLRNSPDSGSDAHLSDIMNFFTDNELKNIAASLAIEKDSWTREACLTLIAQFESGISRYENRLLQKKIKAADEGDNGELLLELLRKKQNRAREKAIKKRLQHELKGV